MENFCPAVGLEKKLSVVFRGGLVFLESSELYDLGAYPGMSHGRGTVVGEWSIVSPEALIVLDKIIIVLLQLRIAPTYVD